MLIAHYAIREQILPKRVSGVGKNIVRNTIKGIRTIAHGNMGELAKNAASGVWLFLNSSQDENLRVLRGR